jgi:photosystem II stability/assembly factor-like uncharacterized protein
MWFAWLVWCSHASILVAQWNVCDVPTGSAASLRGLVAIDSRTVWVCGTNGTILRTQESGEQWESCAIPGWEQVDFRSIHAWDAERAIVATAGQPSAIHKTNDGGKTWSQVYSNAAPEAFLDAVRFWDPNYGMAFGDPIDGNLQVLITRDAGSTWDNANRIGIAMERGEAAFAASNSSMSLFGQKNAVIGLGGGAGTARMLRSVDRGATWQRIEVGPMQRGESAGVFSVAIADSGLGIAVGGDYKAMDKAEGHIALTEDAGVSWRLPKGSLPRGYRSAVIDAPTERGKIWIAVGPTGCDWSSDGEDWSPLSDVGFHALSVGNDGSIWASGTQGRVAKLWVSKPVPE